jgi:hypothetical protein
MNGEVKNALTGAIRPPKALKTNLVDSSPYNALWILSLKIHTSRIAKS